MVKTAVVDNGGQYTHRIKRTLEDAGSEAEIISNTTKIEDIEADSLVFSGSGSLVGQGEEAGMGSCSKYLEKFDGPILGMCAGHQLIAKKFGGKVRAAEKPEFGKTEIIIDKENDIFKGLPEKQTVWNSHNDEIEEISDKLEVLAHSNDCKFEAVKHTEKPIYGVQFHPEVQHTEYGLDMFKNFLKVVKEKK
ncbi:MAG: GMP synthase subunit A [Candidatus Undinarchaeales archaeon]